MSDPFLNDLLRGQRRSNRVRRGRRARWVLLVLALLGAGVYAAYWYVGAPERAAQATSAATKRARVALADAARAAEGAASESAERSAQAERGESEDQDSWRPGQSATLRGELAPSESVFLALQRRGLENAAIHEVLSAAAGTIDFRRARPGDTWEATVEADGQIASLEYATDPEHVWRIERSAGSLKASRVEVELERRAHAAAGEVRATLWDGLEESSIPAPVAKTMIEVFSADADLGARAGPGDTFALVYERVYLDGAPLRAGDLLAASWRPAGGEPLEAYRLENEGFFAPDGRAWARAWLPAPVEGRGRSKRASGRDGVLYRVRTGAPVRAVGPGTIASIKRGKTSRVSIEHDERSRTYYTGLSSVPEDREVGQAIERGEVIGSAGRRGVHFAIEIDGEARDPTRYDRGPAPPLEGAELERFLARTVAPHKSAMDDARRRAGIAPARP